MSDVAVLGCELEPVPPATGEILVTSNPSTEVLVGEKGVYFKEIKFSVAGSNGGGSVTNNDGTGEGSIIATGSNMQDKNGNYVVLEGDLSASVPIKGTAGQSPASGAIFVRVKKAGQTDVSVT